MLRLVDLVKEFRDHAGRTVQAVSGINVQIDQGTLVTLLGPSGCGKTTTLRMIAGFEQPSSGEIWIGDRKITDTPAHERDTPMVFQSYALFPHLSVRDNAIFGLSMRKLERAKAVARVDDLARSMGLSDLLDRAPNQLSGGQQQRVALLRALVTEPKVLLFDEPLSNLDARLRVSMRTEIRRIQRRSGITAVYVTHDQEEAMVLSDKIVVMDRGRIAQVGPPREVYLRPADRFVAGFLGDANFIRATAVGRSGELLEIECVLGRMGITSDLAGKLTLVIRPEAVRIEREASSGSIEARIVSATFLGAESRYELDVSGTMLTARSADAGLTEGGTVFVRVDAERAHALPAD
jgi:iron(III) transport system ATP-binding protein